MPGEEDPEPEVFNPRPRVEGDPPIARGPRPPSGFNPRPRVEGDATARPRPSRAPCFNPRPRVEGDGPPGLLTFSSISFQSAPPRGGRRSSACDRSQTTVWFQSRAPAWRGDPSSICGSTVSRGFNPRPRVEGDETARPPRGRAPGFNPRPPRGGRPIMAPYTSPVGLFQSAPPRGGRPVTPDKAGVPRLFQSAPPRGGRRYAIPEVTDFAYVSIRAPAWRATRSRVAGVASPGFNPRPRVEGDRRHPRLSGPSRKFQSAPPRGGRPRHRIHLIKERKPALSREPGARRPACVALAAHNLEKVVRIP